MTKSEFIWNPTVPALPLGRRKMTRSSSHIIWLCYNWIVPLLQTEWHAQLHVPLFALGLVPMLPWPDWPSAFYLIAYRSLISVSITFHRMIGLSYSILSKEAEVERSLHTRLKRKHSEHRNRLWKLNQVFGWRDEQLSDSPSTASGRLRWFRCIHWRVPWLRVGSAERVSNDMIASNLFMLLSILCGEIKSKWMNARRGVETFATRVELVDKPRKWKGGPKHLKAAKAAMEERLNLREHSLSFCWRNPFAWVSDSSLFLNILVWKT